MKRRQWAVVAVLVAGLAWALFGRTGSEGPTGYRTATVDRGDVVSVVGATGTLEAVTTVQVGSQVSGTVSRLYADFNSHVKQGHVVARLDPSLFEARLGQARANLVAAQANAERNRAQADEADLQWRRAQELAGQHLLAQADLDSARTTREAAVAQVKAAEAAVSQAAAAVNQAEVDLAHTVIEAPIDGIVIARNVDVGQTVAASLQAPVLFVIAEDLARMQVRAAIDEADVGRVRAGQDVEFRVDAFPDELFHGSVVQVRLQPNVVQNVVTYDTIIGVDNSQLKLMPGLTATVSVIVERRENVLRVPVAALRFRPDGFGETPGASRSGRPPGDGTVGDAPRRHGSRPSAGGGDAPPRGPGAGRRMTPGGGPDQAAVAEAGVPNDRVGAAPDRDARDGHRGLVFVLEQGRPTPRPIVTGSSDGRYTEVRHGLEEHAPVVVGVEFAAPGSASASPTPNNPFAPTRQRRER